MYNGHYAVAFAAKKAAPRTSLGTLIAASQLIDLIWPVLVLLGVERVTVEPGNTVVTPLNFQHYPYTHSLVAVLGWACLASGLYWTLTRYRGGGDHHRPGRCQSLGPGPAYPYARPAPVPWGRSEVGAGGEVGDIKHDGREE